MRLSVVVIEPMGMGGIAHYTFRLCDALASQGARCALITAADYELTDLPRRFALHRILPSWGSPEPPRHSAPPAGGAWARWRQRWRSLAILAAMMVVILKQRPGVIHAQWIRSPHDSRLFQLLRRFGRRIVYTAHDVVPFEAQADYERRIRRYLREVDHVIVHSAESLERFRRMFPDGEISAHVVAMGDLDVFPHHEESRDDARRHLGLPRTPPIVLFFGGIRPYKGLMDLIRAFHTVHRELPEASLMIAGPLFETFDAYAGEINALGLSERVICRLGYQPIAQVPHLFRASDVVVLPYRTASQSGVVQVAFSMRVPVVATRVGGIPEIVQDGVSGLLVEAGDVPGLAGAVLRVVRDRILADRLVAQAQATAASEYSWDAIARRTAEIYGLNHRRSSQAAGTRLDVKTP